jgi:hypothetical protein
LSEIVFSGQTRLKEISGFQKCVSLSRIEIPSSVVIIENNSFRGCTSLNNIVFSSGSHLQRVAVFLLHVNVRSFPFPLEASRSFTRLHSVRTPYSMGNSCTEEKKVGIEMKSQMTSHVKSFCGAILIVTLAFCVLLITSHLSETDD